MMPLGFARSNLSHASGLGTPQSSHNYNDDIGGNLSSLLANLNQSYSPGNSSHFTSITNHIRSQGYTLIAVPIYGSLAENMSNIDNIYNYTAGGRFLSNVYRFDNYKESGANFGNVGSSYDNTHWTEPSHLRVSTGFSTHYSQAAMDGHPFLCLAFWNGASFKGIITLVYRSIGTTTTHAIGGGAAGNLPAGVHRLYDLYYPDQNRDVYAHVLTPSSSNFYMGSSQSIRFSHEANFSATHGTNSASVFSQDDGQWGFQVNVTNSGGGASDIGMSGTEAYGFNNKNGGDTNANTFFWGDGGSTSTNYYCFVFTRFV